MKYQGEELVRVTSHDELRVGRLIVVDPCRWCARRHVVTLLRERPPTGSHLDWSPCTARSAWIAYPMGHSTSGFCFCDSIAEGRVYRLQEPPAEVNDYDVVAVPAKAKERTR